MARTRSQKKFLSSLANCKKTIRASSAEEVKKHTKPCSIILERIDLNIETKKPPVKNYLKRVQPVRKRVQPVTIDGSKYKSEMKKDQIKIVKKITGKKQTDFKVGSTVLAKQRHSVPWPARILSIRSTYVDVHFYGDGRTGPVKRDEIYSFSESSDVILSCIKRNLTGYLKGIRELEMANCIPQHMSISNII